MSSLIKLSRTVLYTPCDRLKVMEKLLTLSMPPDVIMFDLEDAVSPDNKAIARDNVYNFLMNHRSKISSRVIVRVNCRKSTVWGNDDLLAARAMPVDGIALPKVDCDLNILFSSRKLGNKIPIWCMIETASGVQNIDSISSNSNVEALVFGSNDLMKDLGTPSVSNRYPLWYSMSRCVASARASKKLCFDGVFMDIKDSEGLKEDSLRSKEFGFDGKTIIHPNQIDIVNEIFSPSDQEVNYAERVIKAYIDCRQKGLSVAVLDGKLIENLHYDQAIKTVAKREAILHKKVI